MKTLILATLVAGFSFAPGFAQDAPAPGPRGQDFHPRMMARIERSLNLTDAQKAAFADIRAKHTPQAEAKRKAAQDARKAFQDAMAKEDTPAADLRKLHQTMADANLDVLLEHRAARQEFHAILTPEQREKAARMEGRFEGMMMGRRGGHPGRDHR